MSTLIDSEYIHQPNNVSRDYDGLKIQNQQLSKDILDLAAQMDIIAHQLKPAARAVHDEIHVQSEKSLAILDQEKHIKSLKAKITRTQNYLDKIYDVDKVIKQEDELKVIKQEEDKVKDEYSSLMKINKDQKDSIEQQKDEFYQKKLASFKKQFSELRQENRDLVNKINQIEKTLRVKHYKQVTKEEKIKNVNLYMNSTKYKKDYQVITEEMILEKEKELVKLKHDRKQREQDQIDAIKKLEIKIQEVEEVLAEKIEQKAEIDKNFKSNQLKMKEIQKMQSFNNSIGANISMIRPHHNRTNNDLGNSISIFDNNNEKDQILNQLDHEPKQQPKKEEQINSEMRQPVKKVVSLESEEMLIKRLPSMEGDRQLELQKQKINNHRENSEEKSKKNRLSEHVVEFETQKESEQKSDFKNPVQDVNERMEIKSQSPQKQPQRQNSLKSKKSEKLSRQNSKSPQKLDTSMVSQKSKKSVKSNKSNKSLDKTDQQSVKSLQQNQHQPAANERLEKSLSQVSKKSNKSKSKDKGKQKLNDSKASLDKSISQQSSLKDKSKKNVKQSKLNVSQSKKEKSNSSQLQDEISKNMEQKKPMSYNKSRLQKLNKNINSIEQKSQKNAGFDHQKLKQQIDEIQQISKQLNMNPKQSFMQVVKQTQKLNQSSVQKSEDYENKNKFQKLDIKFQASNYNKKFYGKTNQKSNQSLNSKSIKVSNQLNPLDDKKSNLSSYAPNKFDDMIKKQKQVKNSRYQEDQISFSQQNEFDQTKQNIDSIVKSDLS